MTEHIVINLQDDSDSDDDDASRSSSLISDSGKLCGAAAVSPYPLITASPTPYHTKPLSRFSGPVWNLSICTTGSVAREAIITMSSSEDDVPSSKSVRPSITKHKQQKYRSQWENDDRFKKWLEADKTHAFKARCRLCNVFMNAELIVLKNHDKSKKRQELMLNLKHKSQPKITALGKSGIYPLNKDEILKRLPSKIASADLELVGESFLSHLEKKRSEIVTPRSSRKKKLNVPAGQSITEQDLIQQQEEKIPKEKPKQKKKRNTKKNKCGDFLSSDEECDTYSIVSSGHRYLIFSSDEEVYVSQPTKTRKREKCELILQSSGLGSKTHNSSVVENEPMESTLQTTLETHSVKDAVEEGKFVVVTWNGKQFPGLVMSVLDTGAIVDCMQPTPRYWKWPNEKDLLFYKWSDIVQLINPPKLLKRGLFSWGKVTQFYGKEMLSKMTASNLYKERDRDAAGTSGMSGDSEPIVEGVDIDDSEENTVIQVCASSSQTVNNSSSTGLISGSEKPNTAFIMVSLPSVGHPIRYGSGLLSATFDPSIPITSSAGALETTLNLNNPPNKKSTSFAKNNDLYDDDDEGNVSDVHYLFCGDCYSKSKDNEGRIRCSGWLTKSAQKLKRRTMSLFVIYLINSVFGGKQFSRKLLEQVFVTIESFA
ncbi:hypothetical protein J6590_098818 [Homalodisca vitripennis]|nr:hypothetical protein J6590_098818 [Homalodisca vitripennis]